MGYCFGIRSERRLCEEVHLNLAYRWFCRLGLEDAVPEHSTFSKNRHGRFRDSDVLRHVFESVLGRCMSEGLVKGEGFAIDANAIIRADAGPARGAPGTESINWGCVKGQSRAVGEYLKALEEANPAGADAVEEAETSTPPKKISLTDPAASWTAAKGGPAFFAYSTNYLIDLQAGIIVDVEATPANRSHEVESTRTMIDRVERRHDLKPRRLAGDTAYGSATSHDKQNEFIEQTRKFDMDIGCFPWICAQTSIFGDSANHRAIDMPILNSFVLLWLAD